MESCNQVIENDEGAILSEALLTFEDSSEVNEGMCSCVCINDEQCCGCLLQ